MLAALSRLSLGILAALFRSHGLRAPNGPLQGGPDRNKCARSVRENKTLLFWLLRDQLKFQNLPVCCDLTRAGKSETAFSPV